jgi:hypothetical protein
MHPPFPRPEIQPQHWFARLLRRPHHDALLPLVWDELVTLAKTRDPVAAAERLAPVAGSFNWHGHFEDRFREWFGEYVKVALQDGALSDDEAGYLAEVRALLGLSESKAGQVVASRVRERYTLELAEVMKDGVISSAESAVIKRLVGSLPLSEGDLALVRRTSIQPFMQQAIARATGDGQLSPQEERDLERAAGALGIPLEYDKRTRASLDRYRTLWAVAHGELEVIDCGIALQRGELCHLAVDVEFAEQRTVTVRRSHSGPTFRVKVVKGLYWSTGSYKVGRVTREQLVRLDSGRLYVTNKRLLFNGNAKNISLKLTKVLDVERYSDGIRVDKDSGRDAFFLTSADSEILAAVIARVVMDDRSE